MTRKTLSRTLTTLLIPALALLAAPAALADDADDVMEVVYRWAATEHDLEEQAKLIRSDRIQVAGGVRQSDQAGNLAVQLANHRARVRMAGGEPQMMVRIESPIVRVYGGDTAVVSFVRLFNVIPNNQAPVNSSAWFTLVLVKERGEWGIAHSHVSGAGNN